MGLDWIPVPPRRKEVPASVYNAGKTLLAEREKEVDELEKQIRIKMGVDPEKVNYNEDIVFKLRLASDSQRETERKLGEMRVSKVEVLDIPKIGHDKEATDFIKRIIDERAKEIEEESKKGRSSNPAYVKYWTRNKDKILFDEWDKPVSDLIPKKRGLGAVTGMIMVGPDSFRGKALGSCSFMPSDCNAYEDMTPKEMIKFALSLEKAGKEFAEEKKMDWEKIGTADKETENDDEYSIWIAYQAINWLRFWANNNFSLHAWY